jgi:hypothetical protein
MQLGIGKRAPTGLPLEMNLTHRRTFPDIA